jgi:hypothetical protein
MNRDRWAQEQRYSWIYETVQIFGFINREHIVRKFWVSVPQASLDLKRVMLRWPGLMTYNKQTKRYEALP